MMKLNFTENINKAIQFIRNKGSELDNAKLNVILDEDLERSQQQILDYFTLQQNSDGGFPYKKIRKNISTINHTTVALMSLIDYGLEDTDIVQEGIEFFIRMQTDDGNWDEPEALKEFNPPVWDSPGDLNSQIWLTMNVCHLLIRLGMIPSPYLNNGVNFVLKHRDEQGKIKGYLHSNWIAIAVFGVLEGSNSKLAKTFIEIIEKNKVNLLGSSDLIWCLKCMLDGGVTEEHQLVKEMITSLFDNQRKDGSWASVDGLDFDIESTLAAIQVVKRLEL